MGESVTVLSGTLIREGSDAWRWRDGLPEPRVRDASPDEWNFRCRTYGSGRTFVEVPAGHAREFEALRWVLDGAREGRYRSGRSGDRTGPVTIREDGTPARMHIPPGTDPLRGHEPVLAPGPIPSVILVPIEDWDAWVAANPAGAEWDKADEAAILERARELGWTP